MSPHDQQLLEDYGVDVKRTLARFVNNENMMMMFLKELPQDESMPAILAARQSGDEAAYKASVHSLKGLSGNLGLTSLFEVASALMTALRTGTPEESEALFPQLLNEFDRAVALVQQLD